MRCNSQDAPWSEHVPHSLRGHAVLHALPKEGRWPPAPGAWRPAQQARPGTCATQHVELGRTTSASHSRFPARLAEVAWSAAGPSHAGAGFKTARSLFSGRRSPHFTLSRPSCNCIQSAPRQSDSVSASHSRSMPGLQQCDQASLRTCVRHTSCDVTGATCATGRNGALYT
eukprot:64636-Chlamydomonas_euryale.AAC.2